MEIEINKDVQDSIRAKEFLKCLGNGKTIYECELENDLIDNGGVSDGE